MSEFETMPPLLIGGISVIATIRNPGSGKGECVEILLAQNRDGIVKPDDAMRLAAIISVLTEWEATAGTDYRADAIALINRRWRAKWRLYHES